MTTDSPTPEIERMPERYVVGTARDYTMDTRTSIPAQWQAFFGAGYDIPDTVPGAMYGVSFNMDGSGKFRYAVACEVAKKPDQVPEGLCCVTLSAGDYAVLRAFDAPAALPARFDWLFNTWLPASGYAVREGAVFERYPEDPRNGPDGMAFEIWAPVQANA